ncbi:MAG: YIP1 family protein [Pseudomonadales bacterium]|nr:YIP1 family protein [Pseudomonadales bacterium]
MYIQHLYGLFTHPHEEWGSIKKEEYSMSYVYLVHLMSLSLIPAVSLYFGSTQVGWSLTGSDYTTLSTERALPLSIAFYIALLVGVGFMSYITFWMEKTFGADASFERCLTFISFTATPMFFVGLIGLFPVIWLNVLVVLGAVCYSLYLLYVGVPIFMNIPEERGFIFSSSILTAGLCTLVGFMAATIVIWGSGLIPQLAI